jgi:hypothetical protein
MYACLHSPGNLPLLAECAGYFSPIIESTNNDTVVFDIRGLHLIFGTPVEIAQAIELRIGFKSESRDRLQPRCSDSRRARNSRHHRDSTGP